MFGAVASVRVESDPSENLRTVFKAIDRAGRMGAELVLFPEAVLTGLANNDHPEHDLALGQTVPGPATRRIARRAAEAGVWVAFGLLEREGNTLYDTTLLLNPDREIVLKYRRITPGWHGSGADPRVYGHGSQLGFADTPFGKVGFLICGDLFDDDLLEMARSLGLDLVLVPFARSFEGPGHAEAFWRTEKLAYAHRAARLAARVAMVNYLSEDGCFGGGMVVMPDGSISVEIAPGREAVALFRL